MASPSGFNLKLSTTNRKRSLETKSDLESNSDSEVSNCPKKAKLTPQYMHSSELLESNCVDKLKKFIGNCPSQCMQVCFFIYFVQQISESCLNEHEISSSRIFQIIHRVYGFSWNEYHHFLKMCCDFKNTKRDEFVATLSAIANSPFKLLHEHMLTQMSAEQNEKLKQKAKFETTTFQNSFFTGFLSSPQNPLNLQGLDLSGFHFIFSHLPGFVFDGANCKNCQFILGSLEGAQFYQTVLDESSFKHVLCSDTNFYQIQFNSIQFVQVKSEEALREESLLDEKSLLKTDFSCSLEELFEKIPSLNFNLKNFKDKQSVISHFKSILAFPINSNLKTNLMVQFLRNNMVSSSVLNQFNTQDKMNMLSDLFQKECYLENQSIVAFIGHNLFPEFYQGYPFRLDRPSDSLLELNFKAGFKALTKSGAKLFMRWILEAANSNFYEKNKNFMFAFVQYLRSESFYNIELELDISALENEMKKEKTLPRLRVSKEEFEEDILLSLVKDIGKAEHFLKLLIIFRLDFSRELAHSEFFDCFKFFGFSASNLDSFIDYLYYKKESFFSFFQENDRKMDKIIYDILQMHSGKLDDYLVNGCHNKKTGFPFKSVNRFGFQCFAYDGSLLDMFNSIMVEIEEQKKLEDPFIVENEQSQKKIIESLEHFIAGNESWRDQVLNFIRIIQYGNEKELISEEMAMRLYQLTKNEYEFLKKSIIQIKEKEDDILSKIDLPLSPFESFFKNLCLETKNLSLKNMKSVVSRFSSSSATLFPLTSFLSGSFFTPQLSSLKEINFQELSINKLTFAYMKGCQFNFKCSILKNVQFVGCQLDHSTFEKAQLINVSFIDSSLNKSNFKGAFLKRLNFINSSLKDSRFDAAHFSSASYLLNSDFTEALLDNSVKFTHLPGEEELEELNNENSFMRDNKNIELFFSSIKTISNRKIKENTLQSILSESFKLDSFEKSQCIEQIKRVHHGSSQYQAIKFIGLLENRKIISEIIFESEDFLKNKTILKFIKDFLFLYFTNQEYKKDGFVLNSVAAKFFSTHIIAGAGKLFYEKHPGFIEDLITCLNENKSSDPELAEVVVKLNAGKSEENIGRNRI